MEHRKEMTPRLFAQQPEGSSCGAKVAVAALKQDLRYSSIHLIRSAPDSDRIQSATSSYQLLRKYHDQNVGEKPTCP